MLFRPTILWILVGLNTGGILLAGLSTSRFEFRNDVEWASEGTGLEFGGHGLAYTETFTTQETGQTVGNGFTVEMALRPEEGPELGFRFIAVVHSGEEESQLLIAQWRHTIIVMNGDDYDNRRRSPRLTAAVSDYGAGPFFLAVRSDAIGSALYIDGELVTSRTNFALELPTDDVPGRLVLGNSVYGDSPWRGTIAGFALHPVSLNDETLKRHHELWQRDQGFAGNDYSSADLSYRFSDRSERRAAGRSASGIDLQFPREVTFVSPKLFASGIATLARNDLSDIVVNFCGFIPFGFFLAAFLGVTPIAKLPAFAATIAIGFTMSFGIELAQAWIPSRTSSLLDLLLNVVGVGVGAVAFAVLSRSNRLSLTP